MRVRVLLADDEDLVRSGMSMILQADSDIDVVAEAADGVEAVRLVRAHRPDVVLMDIRMPVMDGLTATTEITKLPDAPKVVVLTTFDLDEYVHAALQAGATGFLLKNTPPRELARAVKAVHDGDAMLAPSVTRRLIQDFVDRDTSRQANARSRVAGLTEREGQVLRLLAEGKSNADIGTCLFMSEATVKTHVSRVLAKLDCANRVQAAIVAHDAGLLR
ncbi:response regulator transcription factor [Streptomyces sp. ISL-22]|uniref:response regulator transcription factor n=1 Tax=unclassified Streptomyces TaxID=2593676 RepID=UPI001BE7F134|nr:MULTISPECIES: response regulator transcription factor [unclassified Streptomyces]MBT2423418.1 response regulator transcription factor [Streptomyces sp. ISL-24]MBT2438439.1 response regulator transcription factor [Streptomyces sp. ISL-22]